MKNWLKTILSLVMILTVVMTSSPVVAENMLNTQIRNALSAINNQTNITEIYHYHYSGKATLARQAGFGLGDSFGIEEETIPDMGHLFLIYSENEIGCVLEDEVGNILASFGMLSMNVQPSSAELAQQLVNATKYGVCTMLCQTSEDADVNKWHKLTQAQIENLTNKDEKGEAQSSTFTANLMDSYSSTISANNLREGESLCALAAVMMLSDFSGTLSQDELKAMGSAEIWVATIDNEINFFFFASDGLHLVTYIPKQSATHAYLPDSTDTMKLLLNENDTYDTWDSVHYCTPDEIKAVLNALK